MSCNPFSEETQRLAEKVLHFSRRYISQRIPLMLVPIYALQDQVRPVPGPISTDGVYLWYNPQQVLSDFQQDRNKPARQILHVTLHCLLGHLPLRPPHGQTTAFDTAADWHVAQFTCALDEAFLSHDFYLAHQYTAPLPVLLHQLQNNATLCSSLANLVKSNHAALDDHRLWHPKAPAASFSSAADSDSSSSMDGNTPNWGDMLQDLKGQAKGSSHWGRLAGMLRTELDAAAENQVSYAQFLRRFAAPQERLLLDPDSFDPRWYRLGLEQYGDIPLLEPAELSEPPLPDDLVIALDTSGSCSDDVCRRFLRETLNLLRDISSGASSFRVQLFQCDNCIQQEYLLEHSDQLDSLLEDFTPTGFGGTDFRPVFQRVEQLRQSNVLPRVRGLLYLSDSYGDFPQAQPDYPVTFLLHGQDDFGPAPALPPWVTALYLNTDDFTIKEATQ